MAADMSDKLSTREGLIRGVSADGLFRTKPRSGENVHVVVMEKSGGALRYYCTLGPDDRLSMGEQVWGRYVFYVVDMSSRELRIDSEFPTHDRITNVRVVADVLYHAVDAQRVAIGVEDALRSLHRDLATVLRREIVRMPLSDVTEEQLEARLNLESPRFQLRLGIAIERARVEVDWPEDILAQRRAEREEDAQRQRRQKLEVEDRRHGQRLERADIEHIESLVRGLGLEGLPPDFRLKLLSMPREQAWQEIGKLIERYRVEARDAYSQRVKERDEKLWRLVDQGIIEPQDLEGLGRDLVDQYRRSLSFEPALGMSPSILFGEGRPPQLDSEEEERGGLPGGTVEEEGDTVNDDSTVSPNP